MTEKDNKLVLYDKILATVFQNVSSEDAYNDGIYINGYKNDPICNVYMEMVNSYADIHQKKITMLLPFFSYVIFILKHWKRWKKYCWGGTTNAPRYTSIQKIVNYVCDYFEVSDSVFTDIYKEYYQNK